MERISLESDRKSIIAEHRHRYELASYIAKGNVLDISCGIGYASEILTSNKEVKQYTGIDISKNEIEYAIKNFPFPEVSFRQGDICNIDSDNDTFDSIVCLETLEHLDDPDQAVRELARVIKEDGVLIASVPQKSYDDRCEKTYGPNPHHKHKFTYEAFSSLISKYFSNIEVISVGVVFGTLTEGKEISFALNESFIPEGSFLCIASKKADVKMLLPNIKGKFLPALSMVEYDEEQTVPLRETIKKNESYIDEKIKTISDYSKTVNEKIIYINYLENLVKEKDKIISKCDNIVRDKDEIINKSELMIIERDKAIKAMEEVIQKRWDIIQEYEKKLQEINK